MRLLVSILVAAVAAPAGLAAQLPTPAPAPRAPRPAPAPQAGTLPAPRLEHDFLPLHLEPAWTLPDIDLDYGRTMAREFELDRVQQAMNLEQEYRLQLERGLEMGAQTDWHRLADAPLHQLFGSLDELNARGALSRVRPEQGSPEDSLYRSALQALNRGEYARASSMFQTVEQQYPRSRVAPAALYWRAFALYRAGSTDEIRAALETLRAQETKYPDAATDSDVRQLRMRLQAALAARGDAQAAAELRAASASGTSDCDKEDMEVRAEALNALAQLNPPEARPTLKRVLARRDACSTTLRRRAVYILGRAGTEESVADLLEVARADSDYGVRTDAIMMLGRAPGPSTVKTLEQIFSDNNDQRIRSAVLQALRANDGPEARRVIKAIIERSDVPEQTRADAIGSLVQGFTYVATTGGGGGAVASRGSRADDEDAVWLRGLYGKTDSRAIKRAIISASSRIGGTANDQWILGIAKNRDEDVTLRREALSRLKTSSLSVDDLGKLFDALSERELRGAILGRLAEREDSAATDKLIEIAKSGTDPQLRRMAISALARKKDPRTTKLLLDLLEKP